MDTIFVQVSAFRENQYLPTLHSLFSRAAHPERIRVGACLQYDWAADSDCFGLSYPAGRQVDELRFDAVDSKGLGWSRQQTQSLYDGERFTLQIDAHMSFAPGWDEKLLQMWRSLRSKKAVITHYAPNFSPGRGRVRDSFSGMAASRWRKGTLWFTHGPIYKVTDPPPRPVPSAFLSGHFFFGSASLIADVPYDPWLQRHGEESSMAARFWTHGYDLYGPNAVVVWHQASQKGRPLEGDVIAEYEKREDVSALRAQVLLSDLKSADETVVTDLDKYGLGGVRTLSEYEQWSGVDFKNQTLADHAKQGLFRPFRRKQSIELAD